MGNVLSTKWRTKQGPNIFVHPVTGISSTAENPATNEPYGGVDVLVRCVEGNKGLYKESWRQDGNSTTVIMDVAWDKRFQFRMDMLGYTTRYFDKATMANIGPQLLRFLPERNPADQTQTCQYCEMIDCYGNFRQDSYHWPVFDRAVYQTVFQAVPQVYAQNPGPVLVGQPDPNVNGIPQPADETQRMVYWRRRWNSRPQKLPGLWFTVEAAPQPLKDVFYRPCTQIDWQCIWHQIPVEAIPTAIIETRPSILNKDPFTIYNPNGSGVIYPPETVMFTGAEEKRYYTPAGDQVADMTYMMSIRREGWNLWPNATGVLVPVTKTGAAGDPTKPFKTGDLSLLFKAV